MLETHRSCKSSFYQVSPVLTSFGTRITTVWDRSPLPCSFLTCFRFRARNGTASHDTGKVSPYLAALFYWREIKAWSRRHTVSNKVVSCRRGGFSVVTPGPLSLIIQRRSTFWTNLAGARSKSWFHEWSFVAQMFALSSFPPLSQTSKMSQIGSVMRIVGPVQKSTRFGFYNCSRK